MKHTQVGETPLLIAKSNQGLFRGRQHEYLKILDPNPKARTIGIFDILDPKAYTIGTTNMSSIEDCRLHESAKIKIEHAALHATGEDEFVSCWSPYTLSSITLW